MRRDAAIATTLLVLIGVLEARESAREIADLAGPLRLTASGAGLTSLGLAASVVVYLLLGWRARDDGRAMRVGALVGVAAGLIGGTLRAVIISDALTDAVGRYVAVPEWFVAVALVAFVLLSAVVSAIGGAAVAFAGVRISRSARSRPPA
ncbi:MAG TPA: hypothetical protein VEU77_06260 [Candidatus Acidoferrales bacterium]|nr:hypothetical protein [Candidatus Acidoferrales bacterium]